MSTSPRRPTPRTLNYLRRLADRTGTTFVYPKTQAEARAEIERLLRRERSSRPERRADLKAVREALADGPASSVQASEIVGYGSTAGWGGTVEDDPGRARVVNLHHGERCEVHIGRGRGSRWGNPFSHRPSKVEGVIRVGSREEAIERYRRWLWERIQKEGEPFITELAALHGKTLGCYCAPKSCHGDVLVRAAVWAYDKLRAEETQAGG